MASRYWVGGASSTDWSNDNNWATTSGGSGGASFPGSGDAVYFDVGSSGNCYLTEDSAFGGLSVDNDATSCDLYDSGYNMDIHGNFSGYNTHAWLFSTGTWTQKTDVAGTLYPGSNYIKDYVMESGVTLTCSNYIHVKKLTAGPDTTIVTGTYFVFAYPTVDHFFDVDPTFYSSHMRFYLSTSRANSGIPNTLGNLHFGYGGGAKRSMTWLGDVSLTGYLNIHASNGSTTEDTMTTVDMNGYNLTCGTITLGITTASYDGYGGAIALGSGTHNIWGYEISGDGKNTYGFIDWGTSTVDCTRDIDLKGLTQSHNSESGVLRFVGEGVVTQDISCSGHYVPSVILDTEYTVRMGDNLNCYDLDVTDGTLDQQGYDVVMPQRTLPFKVGAGGTRLIIGKKWVN